jgi:hypothetical protein
MSVKKIRITTDSLPIQLDDSTKGLLPLESLANLGNKVVEIGVASLQKSLNETLESMFEVLSNVQLENEKFKVDEVKFTLSIDGQGEISLASFATGTVSGQTGIEFTITKK